VGSLLDTIDEPATEPVVRETFMGVRIVLVVLPSKCSRHNCPAQPHALSRGLASVAASGTHPIFIVLCNATNATVLASACAAVRAFPMYSRKGSAAAKADAVVRLHIHVKDGGAFDIDRVAHAASSIRIAAALVDAPCSELHTDRFVEIAAGVASELGEDSATMSCIRGTELRDRGFGGLWGVGCAAERPPALVILEHCPPGVDPKSPSIVLAGKGIVYDTGGLSIKGKFDMPGMKRDMGGAAGVLGAFRSVVLSGTCRHRLVALLALAENAVDERSTRPDDILHMYSGKTVEVNNTDAEGRLVLGDAVSYAAKHLNPSVIVDMATLTGAQGISTGKAHSALYCNDEELEALAVQCGRATGDLCHALPYCPEFFQKEFASTVADMKNSAKDRSNAGSACAGQFIGSHLGSYVDSGRWLHIDMAYPSFTGERATGYGVALLAELVSRIRL